MDENCPYPTIIPLPPVIEEICYMQARINEDFLEFAFDAYGEGNSEGIISCYIEALVKIKKGDVETICTRDSVVEGWQKLTGKMLEDIIDNSEQVQDN